MDKGSVQRVQVIEIKIPIEVQRIEKCPFYSCLIDVSISEDTVGIDHNLSFYLPIGKSVFFNLNCPAQIGDGGDC